MERFLLLSHSAKSTLCRCMFQESLVVPVLVATWVVPGPREKWETKAGKEMREFRDPKADRVTQA